MDRIVFLGCCCFRRARYLDRVSSTDLSVANALFRKGSYEEAYLSYERILKRSDQLCSSYECSVMFDSGKMSAENSPFNSQSFRPANASRKGGGLVEFRDASVEWRCWIACCEDAFRRAIKIEPNSSNTSSVLGYLEALEGHERRGEVYLEDPSDGHSADLWTI